jgi:hypothetical protein
MAEDIHPMLRCRCGRVAVHFGIDLTTNKRVGICAKCYDRDEDKERDERIEAQAEMDRDAERAHDAFRMHAREEGY